MDKQTMYKIGVDFLNEYAVDFYNATVYMLLVRKGESANKAQNIALSIRDNRSLAVWCEQYNVSIDSFVAVCDCLANKFEANRAHNVESKSGSIYSMYSWELKK